MRRKTCSSQASSRCRLEHRNLNPHAPRGRDGLRIPRIDMPGNPHAGISGQHALQPLCRFGRPIGHDYLPRMLAVAYADATTMMEAYPGRSAHGIGQCI